MKTSLTIPSCLLVAALASALAITPCIATAEEAATPDDPAGEESPDARAMRVIGLADAEKKEVRHNMIGITSTRVFYTHTDAKAVVTLHIDNSSPKLPVTAKVTLFGHDASDESIAKWLNNQYSDGLFIDPAEPIHEEALAEGSCTVTERKRLGEEDNPHGGEPYADYEVTISVQEHVVPGKYRIPAFTGVARVFLKIETL